jgi:hypothetical protein
MSSKWKELKRGFKYGFGLLTELLRFVSYYLWLKILTFPECYKGGAYHNTAPKWIQTL